ncbi:MAG: PEGA domain-containing protein, partial [Myxococcota bacterium]
PEQAVKKTTGTLRIMTDPPGAEIVVNKVVRGKSAEAPLLVEELPVDGVAEVVAQLEGYEKARLEVPLVAGEIITLPVIKLRKPPPQGAKVGWFDITSEPSGLKVVLDGRSIGRTPLLQVEVKDGSHSIVVEGPSGYADVRDSQRARAGSRMPLNYVLRKEDAPRPQPAAQSDGTGRIVVDTSPFWTNVYLGKKLLGPTPLPPTEVPAGKVTLRLVRKDGCSIDVTRTLEVPPGGLVRKAIPIDVKDAKGSCQ